MLETRLDETEGAWRNLPGSSAFKQRRLVGWVDERAQSLMAGEFVGGCYEMADAELQQLHQAISDKEAEFDALMLASYHLTLQWYLDEIETVIGCRMPRGLLASYIYAEDDDTVEQVLRQITRELRSASTSNSSPSTLLASRAPVFFYRGSAAEQIAGYPDSRDVPIEVLTTFGQQRTKVQVWAPLQVGTLFGTQEFLATQRVALGALSTHDVTEVGQVRSRLDDRGGRRVRAADLGACVSRVIQLWSEVLNVDARRLVGSSDYFQVGGTSLNAFKLVNRVRTDFRADISIRDVIENSTVNAFAMLLAKAL